MITLPYKPTRKETQGTGTVWGNKDMVQETQTKWIVRTAPQPPQTLSEPLHVAPHFGQPALCIFLG